MIFKDKHELKLFEKQKERERAAALEDAPKFLTTHLMKKLTEFNEPKEDETMPEIKIIPYLKGDEVKTELEVTFLSPHEEVTYENDDGTEKHSSQILIELPNKEKRLWSMNKTSQQTLVRQLGSNSDKWTGQKATLISIASNVMGQLKQVIYAKP